jgi:dTDP-glucose 4,6-dehydratase
MLLITGGAGFIGVNFIRKSNFDCSSGLLNLDKLTYAGNLNSLNLVDKNLNTFLIFTKMRLLKI